MRFVNLQAIGSDFQNSLKINMQNFMQLIISAITQILLTYKKQIVYQLVQTIISSTMSAITSLFVIVLFATALKALQVFKANVQGGLVSISGDGNVIAVVDIGSQALTILRKTDPNFEKISVQNAHIWIPSINSSSSIQRSEYLKHFKPQLNQDGSSMYYISSQTGFVVVSYLRNTSTSNPYVYEDTLDNYVCSNKTYNCILTIQQDWMIFYNAERRDATFLLKGTVVSSHHLHDDMFSSGFNSQNNTVNVISTQFNPTDSTYRIISWNDSSYLSITFKMSAYFIQTVYSSQVYRHNTYCTIPLENFPLYCDGLQSKANLVTGQRALLYDGRVLTCSLFKISNNSYDPVFQKYVQNFTGFQMSPSKNLFGLTFILDYHNYLQLHQYSGINTYELKITENYTIKDFALNKGGTRVAYLNSANDIVIVDHLLGIPEKVSFDPNTSSKQNMSPNQTSSENVADCFSSIEKCTKMDIIVWISFALVLTLLIIFLVLFIILYCKYKRSLKQNNQDTASDNVNNEEGNEHPQASNKELHNQPSNKEPNL